MKSHVKLVLSSVFIICTACSQQGKVQNSIVSESIAVADTIRDKNGLITISSPDDVQKTAARLENIINEKGLTVVARIDHSANAVNAGLELNPTQLLIFGNPQSGTPLMQCSATTAIDLPQKILVYEDNDKQTQIVYNSSEYIKQRHNITGCDEALAKVDAVLKNITKAASQ